MCMGVTGRYLITSDDRPLDLKSSGAMMREIQLVAPLVKETQRSLAGG